VPNRGEVWLVDLGMIQKVRPALILNRAFGDTDRALISVIPHTTTLRDSDLEIAVGVPFLQPGAFLVQNPINRSSGQSGAIPWSFDDPTIGAGGNGCPQLAWIVESGS